LLARRRLLKLKLVQQHLVQKDLANLAIDLPDLSVQRRHDTLVLVKHRVCDCGELFLQFLPVERVQRLAPVTLKETAQNIVQQLASVDCLKIECRFTTRLQPQDPLRKKSIRAVAINTEAARTVNEIRSELELEQMQQIGIGNLAIVATKVRPGTFTLDVDAP